MYYNIYFILHTHICNVVIYYKLCEYYSSVRSRLLSIDPVSYRVIPYSSSSFSTRKTGAVLMLQRS